MGERVQWRVSKAKLGVDVCRVSKGLAGILMFAGMLMGGLEVGLRSFPAELIPLSWMKRFQSDLRVEIAQRLSLPNERQMWQLPRDDGGPPLKLYGPNAHTEQRFGADPADLHYTPAGQRVVGEALAAAIRELQNQEGHGVI